MQSLATFFEDNKSLAYAAVVAAIIVLIFVVLLLYRLLFGRRLRAATNGRTRQPRLGIVDAYDLDRQRQLVLVRRDNVEHLIMIGGPTDVVIEFLDRADPVRHITARQGRLRPRHGSFRAVALARCVARSRRPRADLRCNGAAAGRLSRRAADGGPW